MPGLALDSLLQLQAGSRRVSTREKRVRRSSSVNKQRVSSTSPLPSLAEQEDPHEDEGEEESRRRSRRIEEPEEDVRRRTKGVEEDDSQANMSADSIRTYPRSNSVSDPLCVSTPKAYKPAFCRGGQR